MSYTPHPLRIQRTRAKGWRMLEGAVYVGRPTTWGNPFRVYRIDGRWCIVGRSCRIPKESREEAAAGAVRLYVAYLDNDGSQAGAIRDEGGSFLKQIAPEELRGKQLACWCPLDQPCHADVLAELAND